MNWYCIACQNNWWSNEVEHSSCPSCKSKITRPREYGDTEIKSEVVYET